MKIAVIGTGYVGLVTSTCLAESGNEVIGIDKDEQKIATLKSGKLPIYEPGLLELVQRNVREQRLSFTTDLVGMETSAAAPPYGALTSVALLVAFLAAGLVGRFTPSLRTIVFAVATNSPRR